MLKVYSFITSLETCQGENYDTNDETHSNILNNLLTVPISHLFLLTWWQNTFVHWVDPGNWNFPMVHVESSTCGFGSEWWSVLVKKDPQVEIEQLAFWHLDIQKIKSTWVNHIPKFHHSDYTIPSSTPHFPRIQCDRFQLEIQIDYLDDQVTPSLLTDLKMFQPKVGEKPI